MSKLYTAKDFLKTEKVISFSSDDSLSRAIAALSSSHDAAFVVDDKKHLLGAVNPYYAQFSGRFPPETKLKRCMMMPPKLSLSSKLPEILRNMLESKIYFLPVLDENDVLLGIVSFRRMLKTLIKDPILLNAMQKKLIIRPAIGVLKDLSLSKAREALRKSKTSRLPVVSKTGGLIGLVTRFDLRESLIESVDSNRSNRSGQKVKALSYPISDLMVKNVITEHQSASLPSILDKMRVNRVGSIILVDDANKPTGIVAYRDVLKSLIESLKQRQLPIILNTPSDFDYRDAFEKIFRKKLLQTTRNYINSVEVTLTSGKDVDGSDKWFELSVRIETTDGLIKATERADGWRKVLHTTMKKLAAQ